MNAGKVAVFATLPRRPSLGQRLTERQIEVLDAFARSGTYRQVARDLYITEATVSTQLDRVRRKLGVRTSSAAVERAQTLGLLGPQYDEAC